MRTQALALVGANALTHPIVFWILPIASAWAGVHYRAYLTVAEGFAIAAEACLLIYAFRCRKGRAWTLSLASNLASWTIGVYFMSLVR